MKRQVVTCRWAQCCRRSLTPSPSGWNAERQRGLGTGGSGTAVQMRWCLRRWAGSPPGRWSTRRAAHPSRPTARTTQVVHTRLVVSYTPDPDSHAVLCCDAGTCRVHGVELLLLPSICAAAVSCCLLRLDAFQSADALAAAGLIRHSGLGAGRLAPGSHCPARSWLCSGASSCSCQALLLSGKHAHRHGHRSTVDNSLQLHRALICRARAHAHCGAAVSVVAQAAVAHRKVVAGAGARKGG